MYSNKDVVIVVLSEYQKSVINNLSINSEVIDSEKTQTWFEFRSMYDPKIRYCKDDLLLLLEQEAYDRLITNGSIDLWNVIRLGWFTPHYHKTKVNLHLNGAIRNKLQMENSELVIDSFVRHRSLENSSQILDILAGGLGLSYHLFRNEFDNVLSRIEVSEEQIVVPDVQDDEYQWIIQLFWYWGLISDSGVGIGSKYDMISDLYGILVTYLRSYTYDRVEFFKYLREQSASCSTLRDYASDIDELYQTYIIKNININQPVNLQKPLMEFSDMAGAELEQLPGMLAQHKKTIKKTAVYMLGLKSRYQRLNSFVDQDFFIYYLVKSVVTCIQHVELDGSTLIATLKNNLSTDNKELLFRVIKLIATKKELCSVRNSHIVLEKQLNDLQVTTRSTEQMILEEKKNLGVLDEQIKKIRRSRDDIGNEIIQLNSVISDKEAEIVSLRDRLVIINDRHNEAINDIDVLEKSRSQNDDNLKNPPQLKRKSSGTKKVVTADASDELHGSEKQKTRAIKEKPDQPKKNNQDKKSQTEAEPNIFDENTYKTL